MKHITFDLETLGRDTTAPIVQLGAVKFNEEGDVDDSKFIANIKMSSLKRYGFDMCFDTVEWWLTQEDAAIKSVFGQDDAVDLRLALIEFHKWIGKPADYVYWSHATFDPPILTYNINKVGLTPFIPHRLHRDIRTLTHFSGKVSGNRGGLIHHNALDDCIFQAEYISKGLRIINDGKHKEK